MQIYLTDLIFVPSAPSWNHTIKSTNFTLKVGFICSSYSSKLPPLASIYHPFKTCHTEPNTNDQFHKPQPILLGLSILQIRGKWNSRYKKGDSAKEGRRWGWKEYKAFKPFRFSLKFYRLWMQRRNTASP